jgi:hypothetical protein
MTTRLRCRIRLVSSNLTFQQNDAQDAALLFLQYCLQPISEARNKLYKILLTFILSATYKTNTEKYVVLLAMQLTFHDKI